MESVSTQFCPSHFNLGFYSTFFYYFCEYSFCFTIIIIIIIIIIVVVFCYCTKNIEKMGLGPTKKTIQRQKRKKTGWAKPKKRPGTNLTNKKGQRDQFGNLRLKQEPEKKKKTETCGAVKENQTGTFGTAKGKEQEYVGSRKTKIRAHE